MRTSDSTDLYTLWKHDEQLQTSSTPALFNAIPFKSDISKFLVPTIGQVFYTDGYSSMKQDDYYERTLFDEEMEVPCIGTDQKNFDLAEMITFDITGASTHLPLMCKMIIYQQGATHEREPPILVRDVCIQWDGIDHPRMNSIDGLSNRNENNLQRTKSHDDLLNGLIKTNNERSSNETNQSFSMASSMTEDDDALSIMTAGGTMRHRVSHLLHRHKYLRQIDTNLLGRSEFYSVPFYQYRGRRYGQKNVQIQIDESDFNQSLNETYSFEPTTYSVTIIFPVRNANEVTDTSKLFQVNIPVNTASKHTTIGYINTRQYVTIQRTIDGQVIEV